MFIDTHCHINSLSEEKINNINSLASGDYIFIDSSINAKSTSDSLALSKNCPFIYSAIGFHPFCVNEFNEKIISDYEKAISQNKKIVAIGEIGLDEKADSSLKEQEEIFRKFLILAKHNNLPAMIHNRSSSLLVFDILDEYFASYEKIVFHCFSYSKSVLERIVNKGGHVSFSLNILRKKKELLESLENCPHDKLLLETDSPYMKIDNFPSIPLDIIKVYSFAAKIINTDVSKLKEDVSLNARKLFLF